MKLFKIPDAAVLVVMFIHLGIAFLLDYGFKSLGFTNSGMCAIIYFSILATLYFQRSLDYTKMTSQMLVMYAASPKEFIDFMDSETKEIRNLLNNNMKEEK